MRKIIQKLLLMRYLFKNECISCLNLTTKLKSSFQIHNDFKGKKMELYYRKKIICIVKWNDSKNVGNLYCLNGFHFLKRKAYLNLIKICEKKCFYGIVFSSEDTKILKFNQYRNVIRTIFYL